MPFLESLAGVFAGLLLCHVCGAIFATFVGIISLFGIHPDDAIPPRNIGEVFLVAAAWPYLLFKKR